MSQNLPVFNPIQDTQSNYYTFSKSLSDYDKAVNNKTPYYFSSMVAMKLPKYVNPSWIYNSKLATIGITTTEPNDNVPKSMERYLENILRQNFGSETGCPNITELAFYKWLQFGGMSYAQIRDAIVFKNEIHYQNFSVVEGSTNGGWSEIVGLIPNNCKELIKPLPFKNASVPNIVTTYDDDNDDALYDNGNFEFLFNQNVEQKQVLDFENLQFSTSNEPTSFDFNCLLIFYKDADGIDKLHGINFINPFQNHITYFELPKLTQTTNDAKSVGYSFKHNLKTVNNEATKVIIEQNNDGFWTTHEQTLSMLNSYLMLDLQKKSIINPI